MCRARNTPIITFINKLDSEVKDPLDLVDEIEKVLKLTVVPFTWPVGMGKRFAGVYDIRKDQMRLFRSGKDRLETESETLQGFEHPQLADRFGAEFEQARQEVELISGASEEFDKDAFLRGEQTPLFFGSAINNFGVKEVLDALAELAPPPKPRAAIQRVVNPEEQAFSGVVFKVQANMDPAHRDRIAFVRICSGKFTRGMQLKVGRTSKSMRTASAMSFLSQRRELLEEAYAGDIIGLPNHGLLQLGDTLTEGEKLQYTGLPFFAPEIFQAVEVADPMRAKQLRTGLQQLGEEGAIQVFRPHDGGALLLGAVGTLQFEVVAHRLKHEYGVEARLMPTKHRLARWVTADDPAELKQFIDFNSYRIAYDVVEAPTFLASYQGELVIPERWKTIKYHALREHAGLMFQSKLAG